MSDRPELNMWCLCGYSLRGLQEPCCPECGRRFDRHDPKTFLRRPPRGRLRALTRWSAFTLGAAGALIIGGLLLLYVKWRADHTAVLAARGLGAEVRVESIGPEWLARSLGTRLRFLLDRAVGVAAGDAGDRAFNHVAAMAHLKELYAGGPNLSDAGLAGLKSLVELEHLSLHGCAITDRGLSHLSETARLKTLRLAGTRIRGWGLRYVRPDRLSELYLTDSPVDDDGATQLGRFTSLTYLCLSGTEVSDKAMASLGQLRRLRSLQLQRTQISDAGLVAFPGLPCLERLGLHSTRVADAGVASVVQRLPSLSAVYVERTAVSWECYYELLKVRPRNVVIMGGQHPTRRASQTEREGGTPFVGPPPRKR